MAVARAVKLLFKSDKHVHSTVVEEVFHLVAVLALGIVALHVVVDTLSVVVSPSKVVSVTVEVGSVHPQIFIGVVGSWVALASVSAHVVVHSSVEIVLDGIIDSGADNVNSFADKSSSSHHDESENEANESHNSTKDDEEGGEPAFLALAS